MLKLFKQNQSPATFFEQGYSCIFYVAVAVLLTLYRLVVWQAYTANDEVYIDGTFFASMLFIVVAVLWPTRTILRLIYEKIGFWSLVKSCFFLSIACFCWLVGYSAIVSEIKNFLPYVGGDFFSVITNVLVPAFTLSTAVSVLALLFKDKGFVLYTQERMVKALYIFSVTQVVVMLVAYFFYLQSIISETIIFIMLVAPIVFAAISAIQVFKNDPVTVRKSTSKVSKAKAEKEEETPNAKPAKPPLHVRLYASFLEVAYKGLGKLKRKL